jgi:hypothetical protein
MGGPLKVLLRGCRGDLETLVASFASPLSTFRALQGVLIHREDADDQIFPWVRDNRVAFELCLFHPISPQYLGNSQRLVSSYLGVTVKDRV